MRTLKPIGGRLGRIGLAFAALISIAAVAGPAAADDWNHHHRHHNNGYFSFGFGSPGYYYAPPPAYYYAPPPRVLLLPAAGLLLSAAGLLWLWAECVLQFRRPVRPPSPLGRGCRPAKLEETAMTNAALVRRSRPGTALRYLAIGLCRLGRGGDAARRRRGR